MKKPRRKAHAQKPFRVVAEPTGCQFHPVRPQDIDLSHGLTSTFGKCEVEKTAENLVRFFQSRSRKWTHFTLEELRRFYLDQKLDPNKMLYGLLGPWYDDGGTGTIREGAFAYIVYFPTGVLAVTNPFIDRCARHARVHQTA